MHRYCLIDPNGNGLGITGVPPDLDTPCIGQVAAKLATSLPAHRAGHMLAVIGSHNVMLYVLKPGPLVAAYP